MADRPDTARLSWNQEFLCALDHGPVAGALSQWYTISYGLRLTGKADTGALRAALADVVARHEILRSSLVRDRADWHQTIHAPAPVSLEVRDERGIASASRHGRAHQLLNEIEARPFGVLDVPLLRAVLVRFGLDDSLLVLTTHHIVSDAWSMQAIIHDLGVCYAARRDRRPHGLPTAYQYREFARWQRATAHSTLTARKYWREKLSGASVHTVQADHSLPSGAADPYSVHRFTIETELARATADLAKATRSSLFVVLLAAYDLLARRLTGAGDLTVPTFTSGRGHDQFSAGVGPYYNFLPVRTDLRDCASFLDVIARTRASCLEGYAHDIPFLLISHEAGELMKPCGTEGLEVAAFEMLPPATTVDQRAGDLVFSEMRDRLWSQPVGSSTPRGMLWALDRLRTGEIAGTVRFSQRRFEEGTVSGLAAEYGRLLGAAVADPTARLT